MCYNVLCKSLNHEKIISLRVPALGQTNSKDMTPGEWPSDVAREAQRMADLKKFQEQRQGEVDEARAGERAKQLEEEMLGADFNKDESSEEIEDQQKAA
ncbi:MAG: hypothetical protein A3D92_13835 [Bacteroidetes bacterium RIFCSPHIGHO2_02_FULL_44_7]|uniref:Uncharacterized protein n=1 Tax=Candidatus Magasanikbacteria bacterium RIFCSPHIGHO2_01_FULL_47_8 TaxID=1798673 RepID=A0A1F6MC21_9BACT|nr:MAG: hypothetical protein A3D92_13835 [Bacteroidetes bacterium RIFCSPHIGHO2_02_FULL_44_7]OGH69176.1 MAG: hypothetical protein A2754_01145 [Candidatus Magasanikbacteria bacterium RIFCSPHIGHO2_01_FULL_47_8]